MFASHTMPEVEVFDVDGSVIGRGPAVVHREPDGRMWGCFFLREGRIKTPRVVIEVPEVVVPDAAEAPEPGDAVDAQPASEGEPTVMEVRFSEGRRLDELEAFSLRTPVVFQAGGGPELFTIQTR